MQMKINGPVSLVLQESSSSSKPFCTLCDYLGYYNSIIDKISVITWVIQRSHCISCAKNSL